MNILSTTLFVIIAAVLSACSTQFAEGPQATIELPMSADKEVDAAMKFIEKAPDSPIGYNQLAVLYIRKARQTGDFQLNALADSAVKNALKTSPNDGSARKLQASLHLTFHRFNEALVLGSKLLEEFPDDSFVYGVLTDANSELGNYPEAVKAAQKMVDLKPNSNSYARVAHIRSLHGDHAGSVEMYKLAARTADPQDKEAQSWCLVQLGDEFWRNAKYIEAERVYDEALQIFPNYHLALSGKGRVRASLGDLDLAVQYLSDAQRRVPNAETIILLADVYTRLGDVEKAAEQAGLVRVVEHDLGMAGDQKRLALFWADRDINLKEALQIAEQEFAVKKDIFTADIYAWCLFKNGRIDDAAAAITQAMRLKTKDARIYYHAGMIEKAKGNRTEAKRLMNLALETNPNFDLIQAANAKAAKGTLQ